MVMEEELERLRTHHWLRQDPDWRFHAYLSSRPGSESVCGEGETLTTVRDMDIPGYRSVCCAKCSLALFPRIGYLPPQGEAQ